MLSEGAFDAFNIIFTVGPYQKKEFNLYNRLRNLSVPDLYPVGYLRIETIVNYNKYHSKTSHPTVMISVGWSRENIINTLGIDLINALIEKKIKVIFRPHPGNEIDDKKYIDIIKASFSKNKFFKYESWTSTKSLCDTDIMISDWTGSSIEYAFALDRPVIFIDTKPKDFSNINWDGKTTTIEESIRNKIGVILKKSQVDEVMKSIDNIFKDYVSYKQRIRKVKNDYLYNFSEPSITAIESLKQIMK